MKSVGLTGAPGSGKSTLWRAVTGVSTGDQSVVDVPDPRLDRLVEMHSSRSRVAAKLELVDVHAGARTQAAAVARLRQMDAVVIVAAAFGGQDAAAAIRSVGEDLAISDMGPVENRLGRAKKDASAKKELPALEKALAQLESGSFLNKLAWDSAELSVLSSLAPITLKPVIAIINADEDSVAADAPVVDVPVFVASASLEAEVAGLDPEEAKPLLEAYGVAEPVLGKVISEVYRSLDLITFFTTSDKESRAWEVRRGATAPEAAGAIHSDLQRGFIRAEVVSYEDLVGAGSWDGAKQKGLLRVEGKDYVFKEGDVTHFRFAV